MSKLIAVNCSWCGKDLKRYQSELMANSYCSRECRSKHLSKEHNPEGYRRHPHLSEFNVKVNPSRMNFEVRSKLRNARLGRGECKSYPKIFGRHAHRVAAEQALGRPLKKGEIVHHKDENKQNFEPDNLNVFPSQSEHAAFHQKVFKFFKNVNTEEVMPE